MAEYSSLNSLSVPMREMYKMRTLPEYKVCILGNSNVGKSMILRCLHTGGGSVTSENLYSTIGMDLIKHEVRGTSYHMRLQIWDTGGHERFRSITGNYLRNSHAVLVVYDITNIQSFEAIPLWIELAKASVSNDTLFMLVGNKLDLFEERVITQFDANSFALKNRMEYFECSASKGLNILFLFNQIAKDISHNFKDNESAILEISEQTRDSVLLSDSDFQVPATRKCIGYSA
ncbi:hypothetical protein LOD99_14825 [Oopsacas minuta]|uniref:Uncharacterized protein n=1 Tax=Oopsacas minuta TaxID=111878 RepID=A0AAV7KGD9_9METZ|nr:hypothetical protein LOD99_14825 [Oopsacas minuta]